MCFVSIFPLCDTFKLMSLPDPLWWQLLVRFVKCICYIFSSADDVSSAELMVLLIVRRPLSSVVRPSTFALNRYSSYSSYSKILIFLLEKLGI